MKTKTIILYQFSELSEEAKQKAIEKLFDINVDFNWWEGIYDDAEQIGLKLKYFDLNSNKHCTGEFVSSALECSELIMHNHGETCDTYKTASQFIKDYEDLVTKYSDGINTAKVAEGNESGFDYEAEDLEEEFLESILKDYATILQNECDYLQSEEAIIETIEANDYYFDENGNLE
jgi:hypothetical protein